MGVLQVDSNLFARIFENNKYDLPMEWHGNSFLEFIEKHYSNYIKDVENSLELNYNSQDIIKDEVKTLNDICDGILDTIKSYLNGFPARAYENFSKVMKILKPNVLRIYQKSQSSLSNDIISYGQNLYRVVKINENENLSRERLFHVPFNCRNKISTCRYSIAGYPCLYLSTSIDLCCKEIKADIDHDILAVSKFEIDRNINTTNVDVSVIELAIKPQDVIMGGYRNGSQRRFDEIKLDDDIFRARYLLWYPLIVACSFIRKHPEDPFAVEYIIPQILMQKVRSLNYKNISSNNNKQTRMSMQKNVHITGIRYFSCISKEISEKGFNYVFPTRTTNKNYLYCQYLAKVLNITEPIIIEKYDRLNDYESMLNINKKLGKINK